ncbi:hypothetical protein BGZ54_006305 [Gamsiella multidivaricata]|nr:hypothetical protein BGZ54_006305 [Gamsiella multidivaricata]
MFTRNEIERKLLLHRPECIRTISLPIQRLVAFQSIGSKLSGLVRFELYGISWHFNLDPAIEFLQEHSRLFGTIRELKMAGPNDVRVMQKPTLHKIIKLIKHPKVIDLSRYKEATRDLNTFEFQDISSLEQLLFDLDFVPAPQSPAPAHQNTDATQTQTLSFVGTTAAPPRISDAGLVTQNDRALDLIRRCANLRTLHIGVQNSTAFSWAVDRYNADPSSLQSIKVLHLSSHRPTTAKQLVQDCAYAFRDSLEDLKGVALKLSAVVPSPSETWFGWSWTLGRLTTLSLKGELAVWFDMESLAYCPKLTELNLTLHPYSPPRVDHLEKVVMAPHLKVLSLVGRWILTDRVMDKLGGGLEQLQRLVVDKCDSDALTVDGFIRGLDKMRALRVVEIELGERTEEVIRECRATQTGLGIHVRLNDLLSG